MSQGQLTECSFCKRSGKLVNPLIQENSVAICAACVVLALAVLQELGVIKPLLSISAMIREGIHDWRLRRNSSKD